MNPLNRTVKEVMHYSIIKKSQCEKYDFGNFLLSSRFFLEDKLAYWDTLETQANKTISHYFFHVKDTINEISDEVICYDLTDALSKFLHDRIQTNHIGSTKKVAQKGDFVISRLRSYLEQMAIVEERELEQLFSSEFLVFRAKTDQISTYTLLALCMTNIIQTILKRGQYGTEHPRFYDFLLTNLPIPACLLIIDPYIKRTIQKALALRELSKDYYAQAQALLVTELGLTDWQPKHQLTFVKNFSHTQYAERIDAGYFQSKYKKLVKAISSYPGGTDTLENLVCFNDSNFKPVPEAEYKYIELANIGHSGEINGCMIEQGQNLPSRARRKVAEGDVIVSSVEGSLESIALITDEYDNALCSTGFYPINSDVINSETLLVILKSIVGQLQLKKGCSGSILTAINKDEFSRVAVPVIKMDKQSEIQQKISESFNLRKHAKDLLEHAKCAVEIAIEQDEQEAINWLKSVVDMPLK